jgi:hypothetical protein
MQYNTLFSVAACLACCTFLLAGKGFAQSRAVDAAEHLVQEYPNGQIDWTDQYVEAVGATIMDRERFPNEQQAYLMALRGAEVVAKANLLEIIEGISVYSETVVRDMMTESSYIKATVEGKIRGARIIGEPRRIGDMVEVTARIQLHGNNGLAPILHDDVEKRRRSEDQGSVSPAPGIVPANPVPATPERSASGEEVLFGTPQFVLNFPDGQFNPALFPVIIDENGNVLVDFAEIYKQLPPEVLQYVTIGKEAMERLKMQGGVEIIEALQGKDGKIKIKTDKHPKLRKFLQDAFKVGKIILPIATLFL